MDSITILSENKKVVILSLPHKEVCCHEGHCYCSRAGVAASVHLLPGMNKDLNRAVLRSPQFDKKTMKIVELKRKPFSGSKAQPKAEKAKEPKAPMGGKKAKAKEKGKGRGRRK